MSKKKESTNGFSNVKTNEGGEGWKDYNKYIPFHNFKENPIFVGRYLETVHIEKLDCNAMLFESESGVKRYLSETYNIAKMITDNPNVKLWKITFTGYTELEGGKKVKNFDFQGK